MLRLLLSAVIGMFVTSVVLTVTEIDDRHWGWLPATAITMTVLLVVVSIGRSLAGGAAPLTDVDAADREGRVFLAKVLDVRATGSSVNDNPICEFQLLAQPRNRAAYQTTARALVNLGRLPSMQRGAIVVVGQPDAERPEVTLLDPPPAHWQRLADTDTRLRATESAPEWTVPPARGRDRQGLLRIPAALLVLAFAAGVAIRVWPVREDAWAVATGTPVEQVRAEAEEAEAQARSIFPADRTQQVIDDLVAAAGVTEFTSITLFRTYAVADALTSPGATTTDSWTWRDGTAQHQGAELIQSDPADLPDEVFDATELDWSLVAELVARLPELTGIDDPEPTVYVARTGGGPAAFDLSTADDYYDAWITADATGQIVAMSGGAPGSPAANG